MSNTAFTQISDVDGEQKFWDRVHKAVAIMDRLNRSNVTTTIRIAQNVVSLCG